MMIKEIMGSMTTKSHQTKNINKQKSEKKNQVEILYLKAIITKTTTTKSQKGSTIGLTVRRIRDFEDKPIEIMQFEQQTEERMKKNQESLRKMQGTIKCTNIDFTGLFYESTWPDFSTRLLIQMLIQMML